MAWLHQGQKKSEAELKVEGTFSCSVCRRKEEKHKQIKLDRNSQKKWKVRFSSSCLY